MPAPMTLVTEAAQQLPTWTQWITWGVGSAATAVGVGAAVFAVYKFTREGPRLAVSTRTTRDPRAPGVGQVIVTVSNRGRATGGVQELHVAPKTNTSTAVRIEPWIIARGEGDAPILPARLEAHSEIYLHLTLDDVVREFTKGFGCLGMEYRPNAHDWIVLGVREGSGEMLWEDGPGIDVRKVRDEMQQDRQRQGQGQQPEAPGTP